MSNREDEYIDYSCSTPLERLARDVETILRSWHVSENDRHVSFQTNSNTLFEHSNYKSSNFKSNSRNKYRGVKILRSSDIVLQSFEKETVHLRLTLWDGPFETANTVAPPDSNESNMQQLPISLRAQISQPLSVIMSTQFFDLSTLFGIGQHIVLHTTKTKANQTFSINVNMMQTALNLATQNCSCRIPAFALPNEYTPNSDLSSPPSEIGVGKNGNNWKSPTLMNLPTWLVPEEIAISSAKGDEWSTFIAEQWTSSLTSLSSSSQNWMTSVLSRKKKNAKVSTALIPVSADKEDYENSYHPWRNAKKRQFFNSIFSGYCNPGPYFGDAGAAFVVEYIPTYIPYHLQSVKDLANLLRYFTQSTSNSNITNRNHEENNDDLIRLEFVSYKYEWNKLNILQRQAALHDTIDQINYYDQLEWRSNFQQDIVCDIHDSYQTQCTEHAMSLIRSALLFTKMFKIDANLDESYDDIQDEPIWGPCLDPLASIQISLCWHRFYQSSNSSSSIKRSSSISSFKKFAAASFSPTALNLTSSSTTSTSDLKATSEHNPLVFSPTLKPPSSFKARCYWDRSIACHTLSASTRCTLAAYLRASTLHKDLLLCQLSNSSVLKELMNQAQQQFKKKTNQAQGANTENGNADSDSDDNQNFQMEQYAMELADTSLRNKVTKKLVKAMDFRDAVDLPDKMELEERVHSIFTAKNFPSKEVILDQVEQVYGTSVGIGKAAPPGRLLSLLSIHMSEMQTPARMAALWVTFLEELRLRWESRETLPLLNPILGFDSMTDSTTVKNDHESFQNVKASLSAFNHCTEPDPNHNYCLISQKLQVFNIGVESQLAAEEVWMKHQEKLREQEEQRRQKEEIDSNPGIADDDAPSACYASTTTISETHHPDLQSSNANDFEKKDHDSIDYNENSSQSDKSEEFFDTVDEAQDGEPDETLDQEFLTIKLTNSNQEIMVPQHRREESIGVIQRQQRRGARCPVNHTNLIASGDQLFAPYLQRPLPLTNDVLIQRKMMMMRQGSSTKDRILIAQRLQKPKLLSDMKAFKAANPGAVFQDFINWYGNPDSPFDDVLGNCNSTEEDNEMTTLYTANTSHSIMTLRTSKSAAEDADQAVEVLTSTRTFWSDTWDEAEPEPASEQQPPLFDPMKEVEMVLNFLDTMHPSHLINQILSVNFTNANFILRSTAGEALNVKYVRFALDRLEDRTKYALKKLDESLHASMFDDGKFTTCDTLSACEAVCDAIGDVEVLLARAASLLHKFPGDFELVQKMLRERDGEEVPIQSTNGRIGILKTIWKHQKLRSPKDSKIWNTSSPSSGLKYYPDPLVKEYVLQNSNKDSPSQLCVSMKENSASYSTQKEGYSKDGCIFLAMKRCIRE